jgi:uncharacterized membrane protein YkvA (DUF1232 family)
MKTASRIKMAATVASVVRASTRPGAPSISERVQAVPRLVRCTVDRTYAGTTLKRLGLVAGAVAYVASPVDLLPEAVLPVVGAADDAVVISWAIRTFFEETDRFMAWEAGQGLRRSGATRHQTGRDASAGVPVDAPGSTGSAGRASAANDLVPGVRPDRDTTGAAAPRRLLDGVVRMPGAGSRQRPSTGSTVGHGSRAAATGSSRGDRVRLPEGVRRTATDYVLESVRKRLER